MEEENDKKEIKAKESRKDYKRNKGIKNEINED